MKFTTEAELEAAIVEELLGGDCIVPGEEEVWIPSSVLTPMGLEVVDDTWLEEPTRIMPAAQAEVLVRRCYALGMRPVAPELKLKPISGTRPRAEPPPLPDRKTGT